MPAKAESNLRLRSAPQLSCHDDSVSNTPVGKIADKGDYFLKIFFWLPLCLACAILIIFHTKDKLCQSLSYLIFMLTIQSIVAVFYPIFNSKQLRTFRTLHCRFDDFASISIPYGIKEFPNEPIRSISTLIACRGTIWHTKLCECALIAFIFVIMALIHKSHQFVESFDNNTTINTNDYSTNDNYSSNVAIFACVCAFLGSFGAWTVTSWELEEKDTIATCIHYFGALLTFTATFPLIIEQRGSLLSWSFLIVATIAVSCWIYFSKIEFLIFEKNSQSAKILRKQIHVTSLKCIGAETTALVTAYWSLVVFVYNLDEY